MVTEVIGKKKPVFILFNNHEINNIMFLQPGRIVFLKCFQLFGKNSYILSISQFIDAVLSEKNGYRFISAGVIFLSRIHTTDQKMHKVSMFTDCELKAAGDSRLKNRERYYQTQFQREVLLNT